VRGSPARKTLNVQRVRCLICCRTGYVGCTGCIAPPSRARRESRTGSPGVDRQAVFSVNTPNCTASWCFHRPGGEGSGYGKCGSGAPGVGAIHAATRGRNGPREVPQGTVWNPPHLCVGRFKYCVVAPAAIAVRPPTRIGTVGDHSIPCLPALGVGAVGIRDNAPDRASCLPYPSNHSLPPDVLEGSECRGGVAAPGRP